MVFSLVLPSQVNGDAIVANDYIDRVIVYNIPEELKNNFPRTALPDIHRDHLHMTEGSMGNFGTLRRAGDTMISAAGTVVNSFGELCLDELDIQYAYDGNHHVKVIPKTIPCF
ncbi:MAG: hypothetical protein LBS68_03295 [Puniceicoccales bacterium]|nr:hypothetical protein [Puniceicoccales bacterium]